MSDTPAALTAEAEALLVRIAPHELAAHPVYVIHKGDVPGEFGGGSRWGGWTSGTADLQLRAVIGERWRGRGPCLVASGEDRIGFLACAVHEFAHRLHDGLIDPEPAGFDPHAAAAAGGAWLVAGVSDAHTQKHHHPPAFVRLVLHLGFRADKIGVPVLGDCVGYEWLAPLSVDFFRVLYPEMTAHLGRPLADLKDIPPPPRLADLWHLAAAKCEDIITPEPAE